MKKLTEQLFKILCKETVDTVEEMINDGIELGFQNEQWFLDFLDKLNKQSVRC